MGLLYAEQVEYMDLEQMQEIHESEIKILNEIDKLITRYQIHKEDPAALEAKLDEYVAHVKEHFAGEEVLMQEHDFPSYHMHKTAHDMFLQDLEYASKTWKKSGDLKKIINFIYKTPEWLVLHVNTVDAPTATYIAQKMQKK